MWGCQCIEMGCTCIGSRNQLLVLNSLSRLLSKGTATNVFYSWVASIQSLSGRTTDGQGSKNLILKTATRCFPSSPEKAQCSPCTHRLPTKIMAQLLPSRPRAVKRTIQPPEKSILSYPSNAKDTSVGIEEVRQPPLCPAARSRPRF